VKEEVFGVQPGRPVGLTIIPLGCILNRSTLSKQHKTLSMHDILVFLIEMLRPSEL
jgi:hypothetical protein